MMLFIKVTEFYSKYKMLIRADLITKMIQEVLPEGETASYILFQNGHFEYVEESINELEVQLNKLNIR